MKWRHTLSLIAFNIKEIIWWFVTVYDQDIYKYLETLSLLFFPDIIILNIFWFV